jgi:hypothetical protein
MLKSGCILIVFLLLADGAASAQPTTIHVNPINGNPIASGTALLNALAAIAGNAPSTTYVLKLDPGTYDLGASELVMKPYVDIEGSGQGSTVVSGEANNDSTYQTGIIATANAAELRNLQVVSQGKASQASALGIFVPAGAASSIRDVTVVAGGATANYGIRNLSSSPLIQNVTIAIASAGTASYGIANSGSAAPTIKHAVIGITGSESYAYGIYNDGTAVPAEMRDLEITVSSAYIAFGLYAYSSGNNETFLMTGSTMVASGTGASFGAWFSGGKGTVLNLKTSYIKATTGISYGVFITNTYGVSVNHCEVTGTAYSILSQGGIVDVGASRIAGPVAGGSVACAAAYNPNYVPLNSACQ